MHPLLLFLALATSSSAQPATPTPAPVEIVNLEQHLWTTMAEGDFATVRSLFAKDFIEVDDQIQAVDALLIRLKHCKMESYELRDLQVRIEQARTSLREAVDILARVAEALHARLQHGALTGRCVHARADPVAPENGGQRLARRCRPRLSRALGSGQRGGAAPELEREHELAHGQKTIRPRASSPAASARKASLASSRS